MFTDQTEVIEMANKMSDVTKSYKIKALIFQCLSTLVLAAPIIYYTILGFINGETTEKFTLGITFVIAAIMLAINIIFKYHIRILETI